MDFFSSELTIEKYREGLLNKDYSVTEAVSAYFERIRSTDESVGAFLDIFEEEGKRQARLLDEESITDAVPALFGVPVALKDNMVMVGKKTTAASCILERYEGAYDATVVNRLRNQNAIIVGKTNLDEFAMGSSTEYSAFKQTRNPLDTTKVPGGSSGGSAAAVAGGMALAALGSDTGGSIRQPAGFCGIVGLKPTYGAVSRYGLMALASSLDQIGPFAHSVKDAAIVFKSIAGHDSLDSTSAVEDYSTVDDFSAVPVKKLRIGVPKEYFIEGMSDTVKKEIEFVIERFNADGFEIKEVSLPHTKYALSCYYIILPAEASSNLGRYDGVRYSRLDGLKNEDVSLLDLYLKQRGRGFGDESIRRILLGTFVLSSGYYDAYYAKAQKVRRLMVNDFSEVFKDVDVLLTPVTPTTAFGIGEKTDDPLAMYLSDIFTIPVNLAGLPAVSVPACAPASRSGMPINFQLIGRHFDERTILALGDYYERTLRP